MAQPQYGQKGYKRQKKTRGQKCAKITDANQTCTQSFGIIFRQIFFFFYANERICISFRKFPTLTLTQKGRKPYLCQGFTYAGPISTLIERNQMILLVLTDQLQ